MTDLHELSERRSLRYHRVIGERIAADPRLVNRARERVASWLRGGDVAEAYARGWDEVLNGPEADLLAFLVDEGERARAFRQVTPFAGALDARERWRLWAAEKR